MPKKGSTGNKGVKSYHRGYDIYRTGGGNVPIRYRCLLRRHKISMSVDDQTFKEMLPDEIWCPSSESAADTPNVLIDALYDLRVSYLLELKRQNKGHQFGFETFLDYAERRQGLEGDRLDAVNGFLVLPSCSISKRTPFKTIRKGPITIKMVILTFEDGDRFFEIEFTAKSGLLTKMHLDPESGLYKIGEHYPNAYRFLKVRTDVPWVLFKLPLKTMDPDKRIGYQAHGSVMQSEDISS